MVPVQKTITPIKRPYRTRQFVANDISSSENICTNLDGLQSSLGENVNVESNICGVEGDLHRSTRRQQRRASSKHCRQQGWIPTSTSVLPTPACCQKCGAKKFHRESPKFCCADGEVRVATNSFPAALLRLFIGKDEASLNFQKYARLYNNFFAFSSLGGQIDCKTYRGIYVFKLHGQIYHYLPNLLPKDDNPKFFQLYFYDGQEEKERRISCFTELKAEVVQILIEVMKSNPYAQFFKSLRDMNIDEYTTIRINKNPLLDQRVYNAPTSNEVAAIWLDSSSSSESSGPYIVVTGKEETCHRIMHYYGCYDPLQYPLLFPCGDSGWRPGLKRVKKNGILRTDLANPVMTATSAEDLLLEEDTLAAQGRCNKEKDISCREYYCYLLQIRPGNVLLLARRLLQQFYVDMYVKVENCRLDFLRNNQKSIRADLYQGVLDMAEAGEDDSSKIGHRVVLPPSFIGGPRDMRRRYLNAMSLVQKFGKPDLFCTMTCNPNWIEIRQELATGEQPHDRPDLLARIFRAKLITAKKEMMEEKAFGDVAAYIYVVEFQKRGLPHAHFLIILKPQYKIRTPEDFDRFVSAEIPPESQPHLRKAVLTHMMHGPCGIMHQDCPCMREVHRKKRCKFNYPKEFAAYTTSNSNGYPVYKRKDTGEKVKIRQEELDNRWVIPYNPYLLAKFDCHFNVEVCCTIQAVKYLYKYVYKGHDRVSFTVTEVGQTVICDEIENYQSGRWVSPPEAAWRLYGFDLYEMYPSVLPLQIHLDNMQTVQFHGRESLSSVASDETRARTQLTEFFRMNRERPHDKKLLYSEFPEHYVWDSRGKIWTVRKKGLMIGRLTFVNPAETHRFYLRLLLANIPAPHSFDDLLTVDGYKCASFQESAIRRGFIEPNDMVECCLDEAAEIQMPNALRQLFVTLLIFYNPPDPKCLWERYYDQLSNDFRHLYPDQEQRILCHTSQDIEKKLESMGRTLNEFNLGHIRCTQEDSLRTIRDIQDVLDVPVSQQYICARKDLNREQKQAYKAIIQYVKNNKPGMFFIDGPGGTGKTFLYCAIYAKIRMMNKIVLSTASSGIAAGNLPNGRTAHSRFKLPIDHDATLTCNVPKQGALAALLKETAVIIWDEVPMANKASIHALDLLLRDLCENELHFGGKIVILGGDFRQVLPVVPHKSQQDAVNASVVSSPLWPHFIRFQLVYNMRAREDPHFSSFLLALGNGELQEEEFGLVTLPLELMPSLDESVSPLNCLIQAVYPEFGKGEFNPAIFVDRAILAPKNDEVDIISNTFIENFDGDMVKYKSFDVILDDNCNIYPVEFLNTLCPGGMSPHELVLKKECPVILLRNIDPAGGLCNGTRLVCKRFFPNMVLCEISNGWYKGQQTMIPRVKLRPSASLNYPFQFQRTQFPIKLSFAMTINKSQGQTLNSVGIYLQQPCFSHGQLYVALSRAKHSSKLKVLSNTELQDRPLHIVRNVVSYEMLRRSAII